VGVIVLKERARSQLFASWQFAGPHETRTRIRGLDRLRLVHSSALTTSIFGTLNATGPKDLRSPAVKLSTWGPLRLRGSH